jgi:hypothetical protein
MPAAPVVPAPPSISAPPPASGDAHPIPRHIVAATNIERREQFFISTGNLQ